MMGVVAVILTVVVEQIRETGILDEKVAVAIAGLRVRDTGQLSEKKAGGLGRGRQLTSSLGTKLPFQA